MKKDTIDITNWGHSSSIETKSVLATTAKDIKKNLHTPCIARGMGRSYGDNALAEHIIDMRYLNHFLDFDAQTGMLHCEAGLTLEDLLKVFVPRGWFLPVTPGTQFVTLGGAIANDVHGKNHRLSGSFSEYVDTLQLMLATGDIVTCSKTQNSDLFHATCGGMGLTGIILNLHLRLQAIPSPYMLQTRYQADNLDHLLHYFQKYSSSPYAVAWLDAFSQGKHFGRGLFTLAESTTTPPSPPSPPKIFGMPCRMHHNSINACTLKIFNTLYHHYPRKTQQIVHYQSYFYPLDRIQHWPRLYGKPGFLQYQLLLPQTSALFGFTKILTYLHNTRHQPCLAVLKTLGAENQNYLSFAQEGYTLALDFKIKNGLFALLHELDCIVVDHGGRINLSKDTRMNEAIFKKTYPKWQQFKIIRQRYGADNIFHSRTSKRLGM